MRTLATLSLLPLVAGLSACAAPDVNQLFNRVEVGVVGAPGSETAGASMASERWIAHVSSATTSLHIGLPKGEDTDLAQAIIDQHDAGVEVEVVTDIDQQDDAGIAMMLDAGVPVQLGDAGMAYFNFGTNSDVAWTSDQVTMSSAYAVVDRQTLLAGTSAGSLDDGARIVLTATGEELVEDVLSEHLQLFGGADATAVTAYDAPQKSVADSRWIYGTQQPWQLQLWLGPQERIIKRLTDAVYSARSNVWLVTDDLGSEGLAKALQDKAALGFDVRVVVGPGFGTASPGQANTFKTKTPDVVKRQVTVPVLPTLLIVDSEPATFSSMGTSPRAYFATHQVMSATRLWSNLEVVNDQMTDGMLWVIQDDSGDSAELADLIALFESIDASGGAL